TNFFALDGTPPRFRGPRAEIINTDAIWRFEDYARLFDGARDERAVGEVCPRYLFQLGTAAKIARRLPDVRIVAVLRHPAERAFSGFAMYRRDGFEPCATLDAAIDDEPRRIRENWAYAIHVDYGFYHRQLQEYVEVLPRQNIKCFLYEDLVEQPAWFFTELFEFIGVDPGFTPDSSRRHNASGMIRNPVLRALWTRTHSLRSAAPLLPKPVRRRIAGFFTSRAMDPLPFPAETRRRLVEIYRDDIRQLQELIGRDLRHWLDPVPSASGRIAAE
ncbi:MAG: sulfotransferase, partial [Geminicoccaceae bacterium]|nr:sulfotransferase [Geminicoccaceae bacterium]